MILDKIENWKTYAGLGTGIARGLEMLASGKLDVLEEGRHELDGEALYASVQVYYPKAAGEGRWEAHRKYIDIQYLVSGCEVMGYCPAKNLKAAVPYDAQKDVAFFDLGPEAGTLLKVETKMFALFFPPDGHMPMLPWTAPAFAEPEREKAVGSVKKIVLKVRVAA